MEFVYKPNTELTAEEQKGIEAIDRACFADVPEEDILNDFIDVPVGHFFVYDRSQMIGRVELHKRAAKYDGRSYRLGGFCGLAVLPGYRNHGYGSRLIALAVEKLKEFDCALACLCVDRTQDAYKLYLKYGFLFLDRAAHFIDKENREKTDDSVMLLGICDKKLADYILHTDFVFHYGDEKGYW